ncbi:helix-turn-helix domain-containing protein [Achromobacter pestifer]|uniref:helix-turn-helix domain-containing protein n=1 Tax=Achromobacter pestifer TaxID=1353889 RepID=UPI001583F8AF
MSTEERESISRGLASGASYRAIGREWGRSASSATETLPPSHCAGAAQGRDICVGG